MVLTRPGPETSLALTILGLWCLGAVVIGASGALAALRPPAPQVIIASLTAAALLLALRVSPLRTWAARLDPRWLVAVHLARFVGFYFLVLYDRGELPRGFGLYGGLGDIGVATLAVLLLLFVPPLGRAQDRLIYGLWNAVGLVDILAVIVAATRSFAADPGSMAALLRLPLSLLPTFIVPLVLTTHILLLLRLRRAGTARPWPVA